MARIKRAVNAVKKRRKILRAAKGYWGAKSKQYRAASEQVYGRFSAMDPILEAVSKS